jgi:hypothetical protein
MENTTTTRVSRSWKATIGNLIGGIGALGISVLLFATIVEGAITTGIALIPAVVGLILVYMALGGAGTGSCPVCGAALGGLSTKANDGVLCPSCHNYSEGKDGLLWQTDPNRIADEPMFSSPLPPEFKFPDGCCVCGRPAEGRETIRLRTQNASSAVTASTVGVTSSTEVSLGVPHCTEHKGGARLSGTPQSPHIKLRSYPYLRAFCQLNGTTPG